MKKNVLCEKGDEITRFDGKCYKTIQSFHYAAVQKYFNSYWSGLLFIFKAGSSFSGKDKTSLEFGPLFLLCLCEPRLNFLSKQ